jgi:hypothetical protein
VGECYDQGYNVKQDYSQAFEWYNLAVKQNYHEAQNQLGEMYYFGRGVEKNREKAVEYYKLAAEQNNSKAQYNLAFCYHLGEGIAQDYNEALKYYKLSSDQGYWCASDNIGDMYFEGDGVDIDLSKAKEYYEKALVQADTEAIYWNKANEAAKERIQNLLNKVIAKIEKAEKARQAERTEIFISYSHKDDKYRDALEPHLKALGRTTEIKWWDDTQIKAGEKWKEKIEEALLKTKVAILLVSANFFASDYVWEKEFDEILKAVSDKGATILWLPVSFCDYEDTAINDYQAITDPKTPLAKLSDADCDEVYTKLVKRIKGIYNQGKEK